MHDFGHTLAGWRHAFAIHYAQAGAAALQLLAQYHAMNCVSFTERHIWRFSPQGVRRSRKQAIDDRMMSRARAARHVSKELTADIAVSLPRSHQQMPKYRRRNKRSSYFTAAEWGR